MIYNHKTQKYGFFGTINKCNYLKIIVASLWIVLMMYLEVRCLVDKNA